MYCVNCGVKLADTEQFCPLCGVKALHPDVERKPAKPAYPANRYPTPQVSPKGAQIIVTAMFLLPFFITLVCDLQLSGGVTWSGYVMGGLAVVYTALVLPFWFRKPNPVIFVPCGFAAAGLYLLYINLATGGNWFLGFAFPVVGFLGLLVTAEVTLLRYLRRGGFYICGGGLMALGAFLPLMECLMVRTFSLRRFVGWSWYPLIVLAVLGGMLLLLGGNARAREAMERKFFL